MRQFALVLCLLLGGVLCAVAQTPQPVVPGAQTTVGCPSPNVSPCFVPGSYGNTTASYRAVSFGNTAYATPQDLACLQNPANSGKTVYVTQLAIEPQQTTGALQTFFFLKRTTLNSGGTSAAATVVPLDSADAAAAASLLTYTVAPTPGTSAGALAEIISTVNAMASNAPGIIGLFSSSGGNAATSYSAISTPPGINTLTQPITLHPSEEICVNFNGAALPAGFTAGYLAEWTEH